jgi:hypothetical protein
MHLLHVEAIKRPTTSYVRHTSIVHEKRLSLSTFNESDESIQLLEGKVGKKRSHLNFSIYN